MRPGWLGSTSRAVLVLTAACALSCVTALALPQPSDESTIVITATATDGSGEAAAAKTVLTVVSSPPGTSLHAAKSLADGAAVYVKNLVTTTSSSDLAGVFYGQHSDRSSGIGVIWTGAISRGEVISVEGTMTTSCGERFIDAHAVTRVVGLP